MSSAVGSDDEDFDMGGNLTARQEASQAGQQVAKASKLKQPPETQQKCCDLARAGYSKTSIRKMLHDGGFKNSGGKVWPLSGDHNVIVRILAAHGIPEPPVENEHDDESEDEVNFGSDDDEQKKDAKDPENGDPQGGRPKRSGPKTYNEGALAREQAPSLKAGAKRGRPKGLSGPSQQKPVTNKGAKGLKGIKLYNGDDDMYHHLDAQMPFDVLCEHASAILSLSQRRGQRLLFSYTDSDGDTSAISSNEELKQAVKNFEPVGDSSFLKLSYVRSLSLAPKVTELSDDDSEADGDDAAKAPLPPLPPKPPQVKRPKSAAPSATVVE